MRLTSIAYGADYNPEQWSAQTLEDDIALMSEAGVNVVSLGIFSWALLEPSDGRYELDWLRQIVDRLHAAGIGVDLATATASPPPWLGRLYPETLPVDQNGVTLRWGSRQQYNPSSAKFRERIAGLVHAMAAEFAHHPGVVAWHIGNEYACHVRESFDPESAERFRTWLRRTYGTLDALNDAWATTFWSQRVYDWDEVIPPGPTPTIANPHQLTDWNAFCSDALLELHCLERDILKAANPSIPVTTNFMGLFGALDYWKWAEHVDFVSNDSYPDPANPRAAREFAFQNDLMRSLGGGKPFIQMEQVTSAVQWRPRNTPKRPGQYGLWSIQAVAQGADGILNFQWRQSLGGAEALHGAMVPHAGRETRVWDEVVDLGARLADLSAVVGTRVEPQVAIVWDYANAWTQANACGPVTDRVPDIEARAWHGSLWELGVSADFAHPDGDLTRYDLIIVPALYRLTDAHAARLREAVAGGAVVVVTYLSGYVDERGHAVLGGYLSTIADVLGVRVTEPVALGARPDVDGRAEPLDPLTDRVSATVGTPGANDSVRLVAPDEPAWAGSGLGWAERITVDDAAVAVVAVFDGADVEGLPAVTARPHPHGGAAWYVGTSLDARGRDWVLRRTLSDAGITVPDLPAGVQRLERGGLTFWLNHSDVATTVDGIELGPRSVHVAQP